MPYIFFKPITIRFADQGFLIILFLTKSISQTEIIRKILSFSDETTLF